MRPVPAEAPPIATREFFSASASLAMESKRTCPSRPAKIRREDIAIPGQYTCPSIASGAGPGSNLDNRTQKEKSCREVEPWPSCSHGC